MDFTGVCYNLNSFKITALVRQVWVVFWLGPGRRAAIEFRWISTAIEILQSSMDTLENDKTNEY
jgi:hypothetical protein